MKWKKTFLMSACTAFIGSAVCLSNSNSWVLAAVTNGAELVYGLPQDPFYYIMPDSSSRELSREEIGTLGNSERQMAINEIYARNGRRFSLPEVQAYFDGKSWYNGIIEPNDFDEKILNQYELGNISALLENPEYVFENSDKEIIAYEEYSTLDPDTLQLAINEIYARHGRKFSLQEYQDYFNSKSWYQGTIEPDNFDENVFNKYERSNIQSFTDAINYVNEQPVEEIITQFGGVYNLNTDEYGVVLEISVGTDPPYEDVQIGEVFGWMEVMIRVGSDGVSVSDGSLLKQGENKYLISGSYLDGGYLTVIPNGVIVSGTSVGSGTYTMTEQYRS